ncbi:MAG: hypothetical protein ACKO1M_11000 [Planctomycetota bacterium]
MKVRACILVVCMTVVPALAMFSHHFPVGLRQAASRHLWQPVVAWLRPTEATRTGVAEGEPEPQPAPAPAAPAAVTASARPPAADRLAALGAVAVDVRPLEGVTGMHVASCRVAMDAAGQLHRVFQAAGVDPPSAIAALADQVQAWRDRLAARVAPTAPAAKPF